MADFKIIGLYTGKVIIGVGLLMVIPLATSLLFREWNPAIDFLLGIGACLVFGFGLEILCPDIEGSGLGPWSRGGQFLMVYGNGFGCTPALPIRPFRIVSWMPCSIS